MMKKQNAAAVLLSLLMLCLLPYPAAAETETAAPETTSAETALQQDETTAAVTAEQTAETTLSAAETEETTAAETTEETVPAETTAVSQDPLSGMQYTENADGGVTLTWKPVSGAEMK